MNLRVFGKSAGHLSDLRPGSSVFVSAVFCLLFLLAGWVEPYAAEKNGGSPNSIAAQLAGDIAGKIQSVSTHLNDLGKKDEIRQLFSAGDRATLAAQAEALAREFDTALKLRLLPPGQYDVEPNANPPLGYASMDLLRNTEKSSNPLPAEIHLHGGPAAHIVIIRRVEDADKKLIGLLHLSLAPETYLQLTGMEALAGYVELNQATGKGALVLSKAGETGFRTGDPVKADIKGTRWNIAYWQGNASGSGVLSGVASPDMGSSLPVAPIILAVVIIGMAAAGYLLYRRKKNADGEKTVELPAEVIYAGAVKAIMEGKHPGLEKLIPDLPMMGISRAVQPLSQGLTGEDITMAQAQPVPPPPKSEPKSPTAAPANKPPVPGS